MSDHNQDDMIDQGANGSNPAAAPVHNDPLEVFGNRSGSSRISRARTPVFNPALAQFVPAITVPLEYEGPSSRYLYEQWLRAQGLTEEQHLSQIAASRADRVKRSAFKPYSTEAPRFRPAKRTIVDRTSMQDHASSKGSHDGPWNLASESDPEDSEDEPSASFELPRVSLRTHSFRMSLRLLKVMNDLLT